MQKSVTSGLISFIDTTDQRKINVNITSNLPTIQIKNNNISPATFTPDWTTTNLVLQSTTYLDSQDISDSSTYIWYCKYGNGTETQISTNRNISIANNLTDNSGIVTYRCVSTYDSITSSDEIVFARVNDGTDGTNGSSSSIQAQYSTDSVIWVNAITSETKYIRFSYDNGINWTSSIRIKGEDGASLSIKGVAYTTLAAIAENITISAIYSDAECTTEINKSNLSNNDAYIIKGYLCVFNSSTNNFLCVCLIQGAKGNDGVSSYTFIRYASDINGSNMSAIPVSSYQYIGIAVTSLNTAPVNASSYTWSKYVGNDVELIKLDSSAQIFRVNTNDSSTLPTTITVIGNASHTSITNWQYSTDGGVTYTTTPPTGVSRTGNQVLITGATLAFESLTIKASNSSCFDTLTITKIASNESTALASSILLSNDNLTFISNSSGQVNAQTLNINVIAYIGNTKVTPELGGIVNLPTGMTINANNITIFNNEKVIPIVIAANATFDSVSSTQGEINIPITYPIATNLKLHWSKTNVDGSSSEIIASINDIQTRLAALEYIPITISTFTNNRNTIEKGATVVSITFNYTFNKTPTTLSLNGTSITASSSTYTLSDQSITSNTSYTLLAGDGTQTASKTTNIVFYNGIYYGKANSGTVDSTFILALTKSLQSAKAKTFTVTAGANEYIWYACPVSYGTCSFNVGGFDGGFTLNSTISFTNASGYTENYYVYRSDNKNLGTQTIKVT